MLHISLILCARACSLTYSACHAQAPYYLRPLWLHHIFWHYLINGKVFGKKLLDIKSVLIFSTNLFEIFLILVGNRRDTVINLKTSSCKVPVILSDFNEVWIFSTDFRKSLKYQIQSKSVEFYGGGKTDGNDEAYSRFSPFCESALKGAENIMALLNP